MRQKKLKPEGVRCELLLPLERGPEWGRGRHQTWPAGRGRPGPGRDHLPHSFGSQESGDFALRSPRGFGFPGEPPRVQRALPSPVQVPPARPLPAPPRLSCTPHARPRSHQWPGERGPGVGQGAPHGRRRATSTALCSKKKTKAGRHKGFVVRGFSPCERARRVCAGCRAPALPAGPLSRRAREGPAQAPTSHPPPA